MSACLPFVFTALSYIGLYKTEFSKVLFYFIFFHMLFILKQFYNYRREGKVTQGVPCVLPSAREWTACGNSVLCGGSCWNKTQMAHLPVREGTHKKTEDVGRNDSFMQTVSRQMERSQGFSMLKERVLFLNCTTLVHFQFPHTWEGLDQGH